VTLYTNISQLPYPAGATEPPAASQIQALAVAAERVGVMKFASAAARSSALPAPTAGMLSYRTDTASFEYYNGTAWTALFGYNTLARTKSIRPTTVNMDITSTSFVNYAPGTMSFTKLYAQSMIRLHVEHSGYIPAGSLTGTELYCAISFNGTDWQFADFSFGNAGSHQTFVGTYDVGAGVAANTYPLQLKYRLAASGTGRVIRFDSNDPCFVSAEEIQAL
jgi:hypothetical protein